MDRCKSVVEQVGDWILETKELTSEGTGWPLDASEPSLGTEARLYDGSAGVMYFLLSAYDLTGRADFLETAAEAADTLVDAIATGDPTGFYFGAGGVSYALAYIYRVTGEAAHLAGSKKYLDYVIQRANRNRDQISWDVPTKDPYSRALNAPNDIVSGRAGLGILFLHLASVMEWDTFGLAEACANGLIHDANRKGNTIYWTDGHAAGSSQETPNFAHGTAGILTFLSQLAGQTGNSKYVEASIAAATYLDTIAYTNNDHYLIPHDPSSRTYHLSWCHGPAGTINAWEALFEATGSHEWLNRIRRSLQILFPPRGQVTPPTVPADPLSASGSVSLCHGLAGTALWILKASGVLSDADLLNASIGLMSRCLDEAEQMGPGLAWRDFMATPDSHRTGEPVFDWSLPTGFMVGSAGVGYAASCFAAVLSRGHEFGGLPDGSFHISLDFLNSDESVARGTE